MGLNNRYNLDKQKAGLALGGGGADIVIEPQLVYVSHSNFYRVLELIGCGAQADRAATHTIEANLDI